MNMIEAQAIARRFIQEYWPTDPQHWATDSGITGVGVGYNPQTEEFYLGVNVLDQSSQDKIGNRYEDLDVIFSVLGPTLQISGPAAADMDSLMDL